jgi:hypothetical protein
MDNLSTVLTYGLTKEQVAIVKSLHWYKYKILDTECFTDILAVPAIVIFINPNHLTKAEMAQLNEVFRFDTDTIIVFSEYPSVQMLEVLGSDFSDVIENALNYYVAEDLETITMWVLIPGTGMLVSNLVASVEEYPAEVNEKDILLDEINNSILPDDDCQLTDKASIIRKRVQLYRHFFDLVQYGETGPARRKIPYRYEVMNVLLALKIAYGLINADDPLLKNNDTDLPEGIDNRWVQHLAKQLILRRDNSKCLSAV